MSVSDFCVKAQNGSEVCLSEYKGNVLLIVNTATGCGFTPQYEDLQKMYEDYREKGFAVLDFPCNQFGEQTPGTDEEIHTFCTGRYGVTFPQFAKADVNGENAMPLFKWLCENAPFEGFDKGPTGMFMAQMLKKIDPEYKTNPSVKWNFTKFLVDREGRVVARFEPTASAKKIRAEIEKLL